MQIVVGLFLALVISIIAKQLGALSNSGFIAAAIIGGIIFAFGGIPWAVLLLVFFVSSSALSRVSRIRKQGLREKFSKGAQRDWAQVLANGGLGVFFVILHNIYPGEEWMWVVYIGAMAAVNADTWATELGVLSKKPPRMITNGRIVDAGTSGGVSLTGTLASIAGAFLIGTVAAIFIRNDNWLSILFFTTIGGVAGSVVDSFLGATIQAIYYCRGCSKETERHPLHTCGSKTSLFRGWRILNNDWVNFICSVVGSIVAYLGWFIVQ